MAKRTGSNLGTSGVVTLGAVAGLFAGAAAHWPPGWCALAAGVLAYFLACARFPWKPCPRCGGGQTAKDSERNYRVKRTCWLCHGERWPRLGTRLLRAFGFNPRA